MFGKYYIYCQDIFAMKGVLLSRYYLLSFYILYQGISDTMVHMVQQNMLPLGKTAHICKQVEE